MPENGASNFSRIHENRQILITKKQESFKEKDPVIHDSFLWLNRRNVQITFILMNPHLIWSVALNLIVEEITFAWVRPQEISNS